MVQVLFIDDEPDTLFTLQKAVELFGHQALLANSGQEALDILAEKRPDIVFVDMNLADMDGISILKALRSAPLNGDVPMIMLSAGPEIGAAERAREAGAQAYLLKPVRLQTLLDVITKHTSAST